MTNAAANSNYIVRISSVQHGSAFGRYANVAVLEVDPGVTSVAGISTKFKGVRSIVWESGSLHVGKTERSEYVQAVRRAEEMAAELNSVALDAAEALQEPVSLAT